MPDLTPPSSVPPPVVLVHARIVELLPTTGAPGEPDARVVVVDGPNAGEVLDAYLQGPSGQQEVPRYEVGDEVIVNISQQGEDEDFVAVADRYRVPPLALLLGLFAVAVTLVGGWRGVRSLLALALTLADHHPDRRAAAAGRLESRSAGRRRRRRSSRSSRSLLTEGFRPATIAAAAGTFLSLALTALLAVAFNTLAEFTELQGSPDLVFLQTRRPARAGPRRAAARGGDLRGARHPRRRDRHPGRDRPRAA